MKKRGQRDAFVFYFLCRDPFPYCIPPFSFFSRLLSRSIPQSVPSWGNHFALRFRPIIIRVLAAVSVRDFLCAGGGVNTFYGGQKSLNYRAAYYAAVVRIECLDRGHFAWQWKQLNDDRASSGEIMVYISDTGSAALRRRWALDGEHEMTRGARREEWNERRKLKEWKRSIVR